MKKTFSTIFWVILILISTTQLATAQYLHWGTNVLDAPVSMELDDQKNLYVCGSGISTSYISHFDSAGYLIWNRRFKSAFSSSITDIHLDGQGGMYVLGGFHTEVIFNPNTTQADTITGIGANDIFLAHLDANGQKTWGYAIGGSSEDGVSQLEADADGNLYLTGSFSSSVDFDPGPQSTTLSSAGQTDIFVASYDANGAFRWVRSAGSFGIDWTAGMGLRDSLIYIGGTLTGTSDFDPMDSLATVNTFGTDAFIAAYDTAGQFQWVKGIGGMARDMARKFIMDESGYLSAGPS